MNNTVTTNIEASVFNDNSAPVLGNETYVGGAICVINSCIFTINSTYMNNSAYFGGAIYIKSGNFSSSSDYYMNNCAGIDGGAIYVYSGNINSIMITT